MTIKLHNGKAKPLQFVFDLKATIIREKWIKFYIWRRHYYAVLLTKQHEWN